MRAILLPIPVFALATSAMAQEFQLELPIICEFGKTCWVQQYPDHDAGPGIADYTCGGQTYDGHNGTDIRVLDTKTNADVVASAPGIVKFQRDGVPDRLVRNEADRRAIKGINCGNGVVIHHGNGFETQYCHMRNGSIAVQLGDVVNTGQKLGEVGYSGNAAFSHVHLTVRRKASARSKRQDIDPFSGPLAQPCGSLGQSMWSAAASKELKYFSQNILRLGFAPGKVEMESLEEGRLANDPPTEDWPAVVAYVWAINLKKGDTLKIDLEKPDGQTLTNSVTLDRNKAQYMLFTGERKPAAGWKKGKYRASVQVIREGNAAITQASEARIE
jgi:murein DD-endopeptidase MepM/ murein hydrolase activator NlpD